MFVLVGSLACFVHIVYSECICGLTWSGHYSASLTITLIEVFGEMLSLFRKHVSRFLARVALMRRGSEGLCDALMTERTGNCI